MTALALAAPAQPAMAQAKPVITGEGAAGVAPQGNAVPPTPEPVPPKRARAHHLWAVLIARIYEVLPLVCPLCGGPMRIIAFITHSADIRQILEHIGVESEPPLLESSAVRLHGNVAGVNHGTTGSARESSRVAGRAPAL